jgi:catalase
MSADKVKPSDLELAPNADQGERYRLTALLGPRAFAWLGLIGAVVALITGCFAWAGGWLSPGRLDQTRMIDAFETVNGVHPGFRRNHAKGLCLAGDFDSNGAGALFDG